MPQLEFTIWLSNAIINWTILIFFILFINNNASTFSNFLINPENSSANNIENNWPW
uniref:ATP synthase complex subunit 8 n=1 Tax=Ophiothrix sp. TaxID=2909811 RepID=A0AAU6QCV6_9ECHI